MKTAYTKLVITYSERSDAEDETQIYVVAEGTTEASVRSGSEEGVLCLCFTEQGADEIVSRMNGSVEA